MTPLKITAHLMSGFATNDRWSPAIDGILAYAFMREKLGDEEFTLSQHRNDLQAPVEGLPLERVEWNGHWWYAASSPIYDERAENTVYYHRRFDAYHAERHMTPRKTGKIQTAAGSFKNARLMIVQHVTDRIEWHVVGDEAEIMRLLQSITHVGARVASGFGRVRRWSAEPGDADIARHQRPLPVGFLNSKTDGKVIIQRGLVPPFRNPKSQALCVMP